MRLLNTTRIRQSGRPRFWLLSLALTLLLFDGAVVSSAEPQTASVDEAPEVIELRSYVERTNLYPIDLGTVLKLVETQNLPVAQNKVDIQINRSQMHQAEAALLPSIDGTYNQSRFEGGTQVFGNQTYSVVRTTVQPQLSASWSINPGGKEIYQILAAKRRKDSTEFQMKETLQQQLSNAAQEYYKLLSAHLQREIAQKSLAEAQAQVDLNEALLKNGRGLKSDLMRSKATLAQERRNLIQAETAFVQEEQALLNRLNLDSDVHLTPEAAEGKQKLLVDSDTDVSTLITESLKDHPSLHKTEQELKALGVDYKVIRADFFPTLTFRSYINQTGPEWNNLTRSNFSGVSVTANLLQNMGLQIPLRLQEKRGEIERKLLEQKEQVRNIEAQVTTAFLSSKNYEAAIQASQEEYAAAEEAYRLASGRYKAGYGTNLEVIDAQTALATARTNVAQAILDYNQAQVQLLEAMGKADAANLMNGVSFNESATP